MQARAARTEPELGTNEDSTCSFFLTKWLTAAVDMTPTPHNTVVHVFIGSSDSIFRSVFVLSAKWSELSAGRTLRTPSDLQSARSTRYDCIESAEFMSLGIGADVGKKRSFERLTAPKCLTRRLHEVERIYSWDNIYKREKSVHTWGGR